MTAALFYLYMNGKRLPQTRLIPTLKTRLYEKVTNNKKNRMRVTGSTENDAGFFIVGISSYLPYNSFPTVAEIFQIKSFCI